MKEPGAFSEVPHRGQEIDLSSGSDPKNIKNTGIKNNCEIFIANAPNIKHMKIVASHPNRFF